MNNSDVKLLKDAMQDFEMVEIMEQDVKQDEDEAELSARMIDDYDW